ncbi:hypothetical protein ACJIZ3_023143 [Penstemon smallii]|uniref:Uncharacterized protein n=1 Tax=Penstemon smallii TaxID=265156 RepID=A0ABD3TQF2_9LAMI
MAAQRLVWRFSSFTPPPANSSYSTAKKQIMTSSSLKSATAVAKSTRKLPVLLFDVMSTLVRDPFYDDIPAFFGMSMKELLECKHPTAWIEFEKGLINEMELAQIFFKDGRPIDLEGLKSCMRQGYSYLEGVERLLDDLKKNGYEMHASTNYPIWYEIIEEKLKLSKYLSWTFCSCTMGTILYLFEPDPDFYADVLKHLNVDPKCCIFIDDSMRNVEASLDAGLQGIQFKNVDLLRKDLARLGVDIQTNKWTGNPDFAEYSQ